MAITLASASGVINVRHTGRSVTAAAVTCGLAAVLCGGVRADASALQAPGTLSAPNVAAAPADGAVLLYWSKPTGMAVTGFALGSRVKQPGRPAWSAWKVTTVAARQRARRLAMPNGRLVQVRVRALSAGTAGPFSTSIKVRVGVPAPPVVRAIPGPRQLTVAWGRPRANGAAISRFRVGLRAYSPAAGRWGGWEIRDAGASTRRLTFGSLQPNRRYQGRVAALNRYGASRQSRVTSWTSGAPGAPEPPGPGPGGPPTPPGPPPTTPSSGSNAFEVVLAVPSDGSTRLSLGPAIVHELGIVSDLFASSTGGRRPRFSGPGGTVDVTTVVLPRTRAELEGSGDNLAALIPALQEVHPWTAGDKLVVYADVGGGPYGGVTRGQKDVSVLFMPWIGGVPSTTTAAYPFGLTMVAAHELAHLFGAVPSCAPHYVANPSGHVNDDPQDILYVGPLASQPVVLDPGHDDYYGHGRADCPDIATSPFWQ